MHIYRKSLYTPLNFAMNPKKLFKKPKATKTKENDISLLLYLNAHTDQSWYNVGENTGGSRRWA